MRAALCKSLKGPQSVVVEEIAKPDAADGEVLVRVEAAALNFFDNLIARGKYQYKPDLPFSPGAEIGVSPKPMAMASPFGQKAISPGSTTSRASPSRSTVNGMPK